MHSTLDHNGFIPALISIARSKRVAAYVGDGANRRPAVHTLDAARLYRLAVESAPAGSRLHAVDDQGDPPPRDRRGHRSTPRPPHAEPAPTPPTRSPRHIQALPGWSPSHPGLLEDLESGDYLAAPTA